MMKKISMMRFMRIKMRIRMRVKMKMRGTLAIIFNQILYNLHDLLVYI